MSEGGGQEKTERRLEVLAWADPEDIPLSHLTESINRDAHKKTDDEENTFSLSPVYEPPMPLALNTPFLKWSAEEKLLRNVDDFIVEEKEKEKTDEEQAEEESWTGVRSSEETGEFCRICHESGRLTSSSCGSSTNISSSGTGGVGFISPCACKGSLSLVHRPCLERWLAESDSARCELCSQHFTIKRTPKYSLLGSLLAWLRGDSTRRERRKLLLDLTTFLMVCPILGIFNFWAFHLADQLFGNIYLPVEDMSPRGGGGLFPMVLESEDYNPSLLSAAGEVVLFSVMLTVDLSFATWTALRLQQHLTRWYAWYRRSCVVSLIGYREVSSPVPSSPSTESYNPRSVTF